MNRPAKFEVGSFLKARFSRLNRRNTIAENRLVDYRALGTHTSSFITELCKVEKVVRLTPEEYDRFSSALLSFVDYPGSGGFGIDNPDPELANLLKIRPRRLWSAKARSTWSRKRHRLVTVIESKGRETFVVDPHGGTYARYVGLDPSPISRQLLESETSKSQREETAFVTPTPASFRFFAESETFAVIRDLLFRCIHFTVEPCPVRLYKISVNTENAPILVANGGAPTIEEACSLHGIFPPAENNVSKPKISI